ncbi:MAG: hypothetical protein ACI4QA_05765 [Candidatus Spyradosoma sp.]
MISKFNPSNPTMIKKISLIASAAALALAFAGCHAYDTDYHGSNVSAEASHNFLGIVKTNPDSYRYLDEASTIVINTDDLWCRRDFSGSDTSLFWGLINIRDY